MANLTQESNLRQLAQYINDELKEYYGRPMQFFLCVAPPNDRTGIADYISNAERQSACDWMEETIKRFKANEVIPANKRGAHEH